MAHLLAQKFFALILLLAGEQSAGLGDALTPPFCRIPPFPALTVLLKDPVTAVRIKVAETLGRLGRIA